MYLILFQTPLPGTLRYGYPYRDGTDGF
jgi:hypothetical protein